MDPHEALKLFDERARMVLRVNGSTTAPSTQGGVAAVLGISRGAYSKALTGGSGNGTWGTLFRWLARWEKAGMPPLGILITVSERMRGA